MTCTMTVSAMPVVGPQVYFPPCSSRTLEILNTNMLWGCDLFPTERPRVHYNLELNSWEHHFYPNILHTFGENYIIPSPDQIVFWLKQRTESGTQKQVTSLAYLRFARHTVISLQWTLSTSSIMIKRVGRGSADLLWPRVYSPWHFQQQHHTSSYWW